MMKKFSSVNAYIQSFPKEKQTILRKMRATIRAAAPEAVEQISYGIPAYKFKGKRLAYFAAFKEHIGMYPPAPKKFAKETAKYANEKGNLRFPYDKPIPYALVKKMVKFKVKEM